MVHIYIYSFIAGLLGANGVPHFVKGMLGEKFRTPFNKSSSAVVNVVWGWVNFVIAGIFLYYGHVHAHLLRAFALVSLGALIAALVLAYSSSSMKSSKVKK